jgi:transcription elongation factor Elf1
MTLENPKFKCPRCGGDEALLVKEQSTPFSIRIDPGPSLVLDLARMTDIVRDNNYTIHRVVCGCCGISVLTVSGEIIKLIDMLVKEGYVTEMSMLH